MKIPFQTVLYSLSFVVLAACSKNNDRPATTANGEPVVVQTPTPASATRSATESIAMSRCQREQTCNNVGADKKYSSASDCLTRIRADWKDDLNARECPGGINQKQLDECLTKIRNEDCGSPFDTLSRVSECTAAQICEG
ncbi:MAG TPA: DUF6184 family natural product biosynthesis lipoprotein [Polyangiaceae bacterium]|nr:DUF6184 family natural product biosynthesis lipoprotein [Polyangiaceae bacterium]